ncbi:hypothetical protein HMPREF0653_01467 [Prevotella disiens JCM 6334 = ATCC 29426]|uniref:Uncharacterized protein n=1 Tax=Prevotella disiens JCM 6334 = ATCC 29426 TaxID=1235811 RepID=A0ABP2Y6Y5_9BACT|nr:hypothetical protein HMPREF0653_01467 [Prevotella disiens JCM 6334 = ATCC 29426]
MFIDYYKCKNFIAKYAYIKQNNSPFKGKRQLFHAVLANY